MDCKKTPCRARLRTAILGARMPLWVALFCVFQLGLALYAQHHDGVLPCRLCVLIRADLALIAIAGCAAYALRQQARIRMAANGVALLAAGAGCWHAYSLATQEGLLFALVSDAAAGCRKPVLFPEWFALDVWLPQVFQVGAICGAQQWRLLGVPISLLSLLVFAIFFILFCYRIYAALQAFPAKPKD